MIWTETTKIFLRNCNVMVISTNQCKIWTLKKMLKKMKRMVSKPKTLNSSRLRSKANTIVTPTSVKSRLNLLKFKEQDKP